MLGAVFRPNIARHCLGIRYPMPRHSAFAPQCSVFRVAGHSRLLPRPCGLGAKAIRKPAGAGWGALGTPLPLGLFLLGPGPFPSRAGWGW